MLCIVSKGVFHFLHTYCFITQPLEVVKRICESEACFFGNLLLFVSAAYHNLTTRIKILLCQSFVLLQLLFFDNAYIEQRTS